MTSEVPETLVRFARAHLRTPAQRAIYAVVAGDPDHAWTADEAARGAGISRHEADQILRRFAVAGIVEAVHAEDRRHRYRWRAEMAYLHSGAATEPVDPVCGMPVLADTPFVAHDGDEVVRFCSLSCSVRWLVRRRRSRRRR